MTRVLQYLFKGSNRRTSVYWMREGDGVAVCAQVESTLPDDSEDMVRQAEKVVRKVMPSRTGSSAFKGVILGGDGRGTLRATGIVEMPWHKGLEFELKRMGLVEAK